jgi:hypothetical protein
MRKSLGFGTFLVLSVSTAAVGALDMKGSDTLKKIAEDVIAGCGSDTASIVYIGTGSSPGQQAMTSANNTQQIAPMSRAINSSGCTSSAAGEGLVIGLDGLSIVAASSAVAACSPGAEDCNGATDASSGVSYSKAVDTTASCVSDADCTALDNTLACNLATNKCKYQLGANGFTGANAWKDALRLVYGGMDNNDSNTLTNRDCDSLERQAVVNNWGNLFENTCTTGTCTQLQHAFRRDDESGTTDTFVSALGLTSINFTSSTTPFCNSLQVDADPITSKACVKDADCTRGFECNETAGFCSFPVIRPNYPDFQDHDLIRRSCIGTGNLPGPPTGTVGGPPPEAATEQVCNRDGTLGVVLTINPPPPETGVLAYPTKDCAKGKFTFGPAATKPSTGTPPKPQFERCPNGDVAILGGQCLIPLSTDGDAACINGKNNLTSVKIDSTNATATDGRVYNLYLRRGLTAGVDAMKIATIPRPNPAGGAAVNAEIVGAFYRIHTTRTATTTPTSGTCNSFDNATQQIGCLVAASPCSIGFAGNEAADVAGVDAMKVQALEPTDVCVRKLVDGSGTPYPLSRKLYLNSLDGFDTLAAGTFTAGNDEEALTACFANNATIHTIVKNRGFITIGDVTGQTGSCSNAASVFCEPTCGASNCANNTGSVVPTYTTPQDLSAGWAVDVGNTCP